jgi:ketosteroid isomerase-like protein
MTNAVFATLVLTVPLLATPPVSVSPREPTPGAAAVTNSVRAGAAAGQPAHDDAAAVKAWLKDYDAAFTARDLEKLATFYHPDVTIYEGGGINNGWADYRDHHLGPELKAFENLQFGHNSATVMLLPGGQSAYVRAEYFLKARMGGREIDSTGLATYVLIKDGNGWKIRHSHTSSRPRRQAGG